MVQLHSEDVRYQFKKKMNNLVLFFFLYNFKLFRSCMYLRGRVGVSEMLTMGMHFYPFNTKIIRKNFTNLPRKKLLHVV